MKTIVSVAITAIALACAGCSGDGEQCTVDSSYHPAINPADFSTTIDNPLMPWVPGTHFVFDGGGEHVDVVVTSDTKTIMGVTTVVVRDTVTVDGAVTEDTYDWYAQDRDGNVWYFGEDTKEYENGRVSSTEGSWTGGVDGAQPGIVMHAVQPAANVPYRQEYSACNAEDMAEVVSTSESVTVPFGSYTGCLQTREHTPLEPDVNEYKYYCAGVGLVLEQEVASGARTELVDVMMP